MAGVSQWLEPRQSVVLLGSQDLRLFYYLGGKGARKSPFERSRGMTQWEIPREGDEGMRHYREMVSKGTTAQLQGRYVPMNHPLTGKRSRQSRRSGGKVPALFDQPWFVPRHHPKFTKDHLSKEPGIASGAAG